MAWSLNNGSISQFQQINDLQTQSTCLTETLADGQTYDVLIRATDIMNNSKVYPLLLKRLGKIQ